MGGRGGGGFLACGGWWPGSVCVVCGGGGWLSPKHATCRATRHRHVLLGRVPTEVAAGGAEKARHNDIGQMQTLPRNARKGKRITECGRGGRRRGEVSRSRSFWSESYARGNMAGGRALEADRVDVRFWCGRGLARRERDIALCFPGNNSTNPGSARPTTRTGHFPLQQPA
jgi:hypothetical protein